MALSFYLAILNHALMSIVMNQLILTEIAHCRAESPTKVMQYSTANAKRFLVSNKRKVKNTNQYPTCQSWDIDFMIMINSQKFPI